MMTKKEFYIAYLEQELKNFPNNWLAEDILKNLYKETGFKRGECFKKAVENFKKGIDR